MKLVTFGRAVAPYNAGDKRLVPDDVAERLRKAGDLSASEDWPARPAAPAAERPGRRALKPERPTGQLDLRIAR